jgi:hypothetical protein
MSHCRHSAECTTRNVLEKDLRPGTSRAATEPIPPLMGYGPAMFDLLKQADRRSQNTGI